MKNINKKLTVTIAIPAFNEEANIACVLNEIISQDVSDFELEKIIVLTDGCTDKTVEQVLPLTKKNKKIKLISFNKRLGKVMRLNQIYKLNKSEVLIIFDGDISIKDKHLIEKVAKTFNKDPKALVIAIHQVPIKPTTFIGKAIYAGYDFWDRSRLSIKNQDHIQNLYGAATAYRKSFVKTFKFPKDITDDRGYLYIKAKEQNGFRYLKSTQIFYLPVSTLQDFWKLGDRSFGKNKEVLKKYFGDEVDKMYEIPLKNKLIAIIQVIFNSPVYGFTGLILNVLTRIFPQHDKLYKSKMWEISLSTKQQIK